MDDRDGNFCDTQASVYSKNKGGCNYVRWRGEMIRYSFFLFFYPCGEDIRI